MTKIILSCFVLAIAFTAGSSAAFAQVETANGVEVEKDLALVRRNLRAEKKQLIALNVSLTEAEATKFWPVYDEYVAEMAKANDEFYAVIKDYAANQKTLTDAQASSMIKRWADIQVKQAQVRQKYIPLVEKVIPARKAALFFQIDRRLYALMDLQVASQIPLVSQ
jgi:septal ring factor EnvC (AmiA/AmiB activator)